MAELADAYVWGAYGEIRVGSSPILHTKKSAHMRGYGGIAQLVRALASHARGRRFESYCLYQNRVPQSIVVPDLFLQKQE